MKFGDGSVIIMGANLAFSLRKENSQLVLFSPSPYIQHVREDVDKF